MSILTAGQGISPQPYGQGGRKVILPVKASVQIVEGVLVSQISGACVPGSTSGAGDAIGVATHDQLGGGSDGAKMIEVLTDQIFLFSPGSAAPTSSTPYGTSLFLEDDHTVGTGGLGATQRRAGSFRGIEDDGRIKVYVSAGNQESINNPTIGTALTDTATTTIQRVGRVSRYLLAGTMSQGETITLGTTGAVYGDIIRIVRTSTSAQTATIVNGGAGAGTLCVLVASKVNFAQAWFDGTNWLFDGCGPT